MDAHECALVSQRVQNVCNRGRTALGLRHLGEEDGRRTPGVEHMQLFSNPRANVAAPPPTHPLHRPPGVDAAHN